MYKPHKVEMPNGGFRTYGGVPCWGRKSVTKSQTRLEVYNRTTKFRKKVHILICEAFHGLKPFEGAVVMHLDDNPLNNHKDNLKWATQKENLNTESFIAYCKSRTGDNHPFRRGKL